MAREPRHFEARKLSKGSASRIQHRVEKHSEKNNPVKQAIADKRKKRGLRIMLIIGIILLVIALSIAGFLIWRYVSADQKYQSYIEMAGLDLADTIAPDTDPNTIDINWDELRAINPDIVGWIMIPDTRINYPIVQTGDNDFYLKHGFDKQYSESGAVFLDYQSDIKLFGKNNMIYGHNMLDGSMFAGLKEYRSQDFYNAHKTIFLLSPERALRLEVSAALTCDAEDKIRQVHFPDDTGYLEYVNMLLGYAEFSEFDATNIPDNIYCLATCTGNSAKRFVVLAKIVEEQ